eukprot:182372-Hanusia_phi.AAC.1
MPDPAYWARPGPRAWGPYSPPSTGRDRIAGTVGGATVPSGAARRGQRSILSLIAATEPPGDGRARRMIT